MIIVRTRAFVSGRVQGVFYRATTVRKAKNIGNLTGWAKNLPDGRVEVLCEGPEKNVKALLDWLNSGPPMANVTDVAVTNEEPKGDLTTFDIAW